MRETPCTPLSEDQGRERLKQAILSAWAEYQATGLHLTFEEADAWLARLEQGQDADPPECHR
jgi:predicted transcriptional regulator